MNNLNQPVPAVGSAAVSPELTPDNIDLIKRTVARNATDDELKLFLHLAQRAGLDPLARQIHFVKRRVWNDTKKQYEDMAAVQTGIDGFRLSAARSGQYAGSDDPVFEYGEREDHPLKATVTVYRMMDGIRCPFGASARWDEYYPGDRGGFMWRKMPHVMLGKCAEALALRKAFPAELSGIYAPEEMAQAGPMADASSNPSTRTQQHLIQTLLRDIGGNEEAIEELCLKKYGTRLGSLTALQAQQVIDVLVEKRRQKQQGSASPLGEGHTIE